MAVAAPAKAVDSERQPVVLELFTSQGCYSCPPADRLLGELAKRRDVIALSFHVDYWNYLGWKDPFSRHWATARQRAYAASMRRASVYTPQAVVDGRYQAVGSNRAAVTAMIRKAHEGRSTRIEVSVKRIAAGKLAITVGPGARPSKTAATAATVWLVLFDKERTTDIPRGENAGKRLTYHHVVREFRQLGDYAGKPVRHTVSASGKAGKAPYYGAAVLVQRPGGGTVIGAAVSFAANQPGRRASPK